MAPTFRFSETKQATPNTNLAAGKIPVQEVKDNNAGRLLMTQKDLLFQIEKNTKDIKKGITIGIPKFSKLFNSVGSAIIGMKARLSETFDGIKNKITAPFKLAGEAIKNKFQDVKDTLILSFMITSDRIKDSIKNTFKNVKDKITKPFKDASNAIKEKFQKTKETFGNIFSKVKGFFKPKQISKPKEDFLRTDDDIESSRAKESLELLRKIEFNTRKGSSLKGLAGGLKKLLMVILIGAAFAFVKKIQIAVRTFKTLFLTLPILLFKGIEKFFKGGKIAKKLGSIFNIFKGTGKFAKIGKGISKIGGVFTKIFGFFGKIGKFIAGAGKISKAIPVLGWIITSVFAVIDGIKGFMNAGTLLGKGEGESVSLGERLAGMVGSIISGLTLGLIGDASTWAKGIFKAFTDPMTFIRENVFGGEGPIKGLFNLITDSFLAVPKIIAKLTDTVLGWFGVDSDFAGKIDSIGDAIKKTFLNIFDAVEGFILKIAPKWLVKWIKGKNTKLEFEKKETKKRYKENTSKMRMGMGFQPLPTKRKMTGFENLKKKKTNDVNVLIKEAKKEELKVKSKEKKEDKKEKIIGKIVSEEVSKPTETILTSKASDVERMKQFMEWMQGDFSTTMAKKIAAAQDPKGDIKRIQGSAIKIT